MWTSNRCWCSSGERAPCWIRPWCRSRGYTTHIRDLARLPGGLSRHRCRHLETQETFERCRSLGKIVLELVIPPRTKLRALYHGIGPSKCTALDISSSFHLRDNPIGSVSALSKACKWAQPLCSIIHHTLGL